MFALPRARTSHVYVMSEKRVLGYVYVYVFSLGLPAVFHAWTGVSLPRRSPAPKSDARTEDCNGLIAAPEISKRGAVDSTVEGRTSDRSSEGPMCLKLRDLGALPME